MSQRPVTHAQRCQAEVPSRGAKQTVRKGKTGCRVTDRETFLEIESQRTRHSPTTVVTTAYRRGTATSVMHNTRRVFYVWGQVCSKCGDWCIVDVGRSLRVRASCGERGSAQPTAKVSVLRPIKDDYVRGDRGFFRFSLLVQQDRVICRLRFGFIFTTFARVARGKTRVFHYRCHSTTPQYSTPATLESRRNTSLHTHKIMARRRLA